jgi:hypothetical protein
MGITKRRLMISKNLHENFYKDPPMMIRSMLYSLRDFYSLLTN